MPTTLFLDRDGVLNERIPGGYVRTPAEWIPMPGVGEAIALLNQVFDPVLVVTNQAGIGKGLMTDLDLGLVHEKMIQTIEVEGGTIDRIFYCNHLKESECPCRKPATGMAWQALAAYPDIDLEGAWMVGDSASDMAFGQALGMRLVLINGKTEDAEALKNIKIDFRFDSVLAFARFISVNSLFSQQLAMSSNQFFSS
jgi:D-glycero-D-manno-heptose 1,7-bisphosphate phosphatase